MWGPLISRGRLGALPSGDADPSPALLSIIFTAILHPYSTTTRGLSVPADTVIHHVRYEAHLAFGRVRATMHRRALRLCGA